MKIPCLLLVPGLICWLMTGFQQPVSPKADVQIPFGKAPNIDGQLEETEWRDARSVAIEVEKNWQVTVLMKHDETHFYFAFQNLKRGTAERYPEVVLDLDHNRATTWDQHDWWFHASYNDCDGHGKFNVWDCTPTKSGWSANNFPLTGNQAIEIKISFEKVGFDPKSSRPFGLAFNVTDTQKLYHFWPARAQLHNPGSWATVKLVQK